MHKRSGVERSGLPVVAPSANQAVDWFQSAALAVSTGAAGGFLAATRNRASRVVLDDVFNFEELTKNQDFAKMAPRALLLAMAVFCSTNFTLLKVLGEGHSEAAVAATRFSVALLPFLVLIPKHINWLSIRSGVEIGLWCALGYITQAIGLQTTEASRGAFLCSLAMIVVPIAKSVMGAEVKAQIWVSAAIAIAGTAMLIGVGGGDADVALPGMGDLCCAITAVGFGLMFVRMDHYNSKRGFDAIGCTVWQVVTLAICMCGWLLVTAGVDGAAQEVTAVLSGGMDSWMILAWIGFVTTALVLYVETAVMDEVDGAEAGIIFASEPVWATLFASTVLGESFGFKEQSGAALILCACLLTQVKFSDESTKQAKPMDVSA